MSNTYVEIDLDAIGNNARNITTKYNEYKYFIAVIKSAAYGHGEVIVNELINNGINYIAVSYLKEALEVRKHNKEIPILIMEPIDLDEFETAYQNNFTIIIHDLDYLKQVLRLDYKMNVHLKIDSGMCRLGFTDKNEVKEAFELITNSNNLFLEGIYSHFATVGVTDNHWNEQLNRFKNITSLIELEKIPIIHMANSTSLVAHNKIDFCNGVRLGNILYGFNVSPTIRKGGIINFLRNTRDKCLRRMYNISNINFNVNLNLKPTFRMYTNIIQIKTIKKGMYIGYGASYKVAKDTKVAILPIGYNNGIGRLNHNRYVLINNTECRILGDIGMNMITIEIADNVTMNDKVTVIGNGLSVSKVATGGEISTTELLINTGRSNEKRYIRNDQKMVAAEI